VKSFDPNYGLQEKSILKEYGYNVDSKEDLSDNERRNILSFIIENEILSPERIVGYLEWFIRRSGNRRNMEDAVEKWERDVSYVRSYQPVNHKIRVKSIYKGNKIYY